MMPWREGLVVALGLMVSGCFLSAYQIATWTATGVSYAFSGKGVGDHALSLAMNQDCATLRVLQGKEICVDYGSDFESSWAAMTSTWTVPEPAAGSDGSLQGEGPEGTVPQDSPAPLTLISVVSKDAQNTIPAALAAPKKPTRGLDLDGLVIPDWAVGPQCEPAWQSNAFAARSLDFDGLVRVKRDENLVVSAATEPVLRKPGPAAIYLVMGSFRDKANAERLGDEHSGIETAVTKVAGDGRPMYRVLAGPVEKDALSGLRLALTKAGIRNSWAVRLCRGSLSAPPCKNAVQQAALP